jgi:hypothetical protein
MELEKPEIINDKKTNPNLLTDTVKSTTFDHKNSPIKKD